MMRMNIPARRLGAAFGLGLALSFAPLAGADSMSGSAVHIDPRSNIFSAGLSAPVAPAGGGAGILPTFVPITGDGRSVTFPTLTGQLSADGVRFNGLDGGNFYGGITNLTSQGGLSGINHQDRTMFLTGVFLGDGAPSGPAPAGLTFRSNSDFTTLMPLLGQTFFIGDGRDRNGNIQSFIAPNAASRLYFGIADGFNFMNGAGFYDDNQGGVDLVYAASTIVPEPASALGWSAAMLAATAWGIRRRGRMRLSVA